MCSCLACVQAATDEKGKPRRKGRLCTSRPGEKAGAVGEACLNSRHSSRSPPCGCPPCPPLPPRAFPKRQVAAQQLLGDFYLEDDVLEQLALIEAMSAAYFVLSTAAVALLHHAPLHQAHGPAPVGRARLPRLNTVVAAPLFDALARLQTPPPIARCCVCCCAPRSAPSASALRSHPRCLCASAIAAAPKYDSTLRSAS